MCTRVLLLQALNKYTSVCDIQTREIYDCSLSKEHMHFYSFCILLEILQMILKKQKRFMSRLIWKSFRFNLLLNAFIILFFFLIDYCIRFKVVNLINHVLKNYP